MKKNSNIHAVVVYFQLDWITEHHLNSINFELLKTLLGRLERGIELSGKTRREVKKSLLKLRTTDGLKGYIILLTILYDIAISVDYQYLASPRYTNKHNANDIKKINEVYKYVMEHFTEKILLDDVASIAYMTSSAFCKYFKTNTNKTFTNFVNEIRIGYACELLRNENLDIAEVSFQCSFNKYYHIVKKRMSNTVYKVLDSSVTAEHHICFYIFISGTYREDCKKKIIS